MFKNTIAKFASTPIPSEMELSANVLPSDSDRFKEALALAQTLRASGKTKVDIARAIYPLIELESKEVIHLAFMQGCQLTEKGAITYRYNILRRNKKS